MPRACETQDQEELLHEEARRLGNCNITTPFMKDGGHLQAPARDFERAVHRTVTNAAC